MTTYTAASGAHASRHASGGADAITIAESQVTNLVTDLAAKAAATHSHAESDVTNLTVDLALKAPLASPALTGTPTAPTQSAGDNSTKLSTTAYVDRRTLPFLLRTVTVAYAATVTANADITDVLNVGALTGNITLANPTGTPVDGQTLKLRMLQDGTGSRTVSFGAGFAFGTDVTSSLVPSTASAKWEMLFEWNAADSKWRAAAIIRGF